MSSGARVANQAPAFQLYAAAFVCETAALSLEEVAALVLLRCHEWQHGPLPLATDRLARIARCTPAEFAAVWEAIGPLFQELERGFVTPDLERQKGEHAAWREKSRQGGLKSAASRQAARVVQPPFNDPSNHDANHSPTSLNFELHTSNFELQAEPETHGSSAGADEPSSSGGNGEATLEASKGMASLEYSPAFEAAWKLYPRRPNNPKRQAFKRWQAQIAKGATEAELISAVKRYARYVAANRIEARYILQAQTFFGDERWKDGFEMSGAGHAARTRATELMCIYEAHGLMTNPGDDREAQLAYNQRAAEAKAGPEAGPWFVHELQMVRPWELAALPSEEAEAEITRRLGAPVSRGVAVAGGCLSRNQAAGMYTAQSAAIASAALGMDP